MSFYHKSRKISSVYYKKKKKTMNIKAQYKNAGTISWRGRTASLQKKHAKARRQICRRALQTKWEAANHIRPAHTQTARLRCSAGQARQGGGHSRADTRPREPLSLNRCPGTAVLTRRPPRPAPRRSRFSPSSRPIPRGRSDRKRRAPYKSGGGGRASR